MIEDILPTTAVAEEAYTDAPSHTADHHDGGLAYGSAEGLYPEEARLVAGAVVKRQREFATVRRCARTALARIGLPPAPILPDRRGAPRWPSSVVGSMTHCVGYRAAVVGHHTEIAALGIDAEPAMPLPDGILEVVSLPEERAWIRLLGSEQPGVPWDRLLFCAKEAVFKTWYPLTGRELDFTDASVTVDAATGTFRARLLVPGPVLSAKGPPGSRIPRPGVQAFPGRWLTRNGLIVTAICLPAPQTSPRPGAEVVGH